MQETALIKGATPLLLIVGNHDLEMNWVRAPGLKLRPQTLTDRIVVFWLPHYKQARQVHIYQNYASNQSIDGRITGSSSNSSGKAAGRTATLAKLS